MIIVNREAFVDSDVSRIWRVEAVDLWNVRKNSGSWEMIGSDALFAYLWHAEHLLQRF